MVASARGREEAQASNAASCVGHGSTKESVQKNQSDRPLFSRPLGLQPNTMSTHPRVEELSSSSDDDSLAYDSAEELSVDPLADFEKVHAEHQSPETQSRDAAAAGEPADFTNPDNVEPPKEEVLTVEELPEEEMKSVRPQLLIDFASSHLQCP